MKKQKHYFYSCAIVILIVPAILLLSGCGNGCDGYFSKNPTEYYYLKFEDTAQKFLDITYQIGSMRADVKNDSMGKNTITWKLSLDKPNTKIFIHHNMGYDTIDYTALVKKNFNPDDPCADKGIAYSLDKPVVNKHTFTNVYYVVKEVKDPFWYSDPYYEYYLTLK
ncbi:MAG: hypothetical protein ACK44D_08755 [Bacteroidia bacterium]